MPVLEIDLNVALRRDREKVTKIFGVESGFNCLPQAEIGRDDFFGFAGLLGCGSQFDLIVAKCRADRIAALIGAEAGSLDCLCESGAPDRSSVDAGNL